MSNESAPDVVPNSSSDHKMSDVVAATSIATEADFIAEIKRGPGLPVFSAIMGGIFG